MLKKIFAFAFSSLLICFVVSPHVITAEEGTPAPTTESVQSAPAEAAPSETAATTETKTEETKVETSSTTEVHTQTTQTTSTIQATTTPAPTPLTTPEPTSNNTATPAPSSSPETAVLAPSSSPVTSPTPETSPSPSPTLSASSTPSPSPTTSTATTSTETTTNTANVQNTANLQNSTGSNTANNTGTTNLNTGTATTSADVANQVNTTTSGTNTHLDTINKTSQSTGDLDLSKLSALCPNIAQQWNSLDENTQKQIIEIVNNAQINNVLTLGSDTGNNTNQSTQGEIATGDAHTTANVANLANTTLLGNCWYFGVINIFEGHQGDIILPNDELFTLSGNPTAAPATVETVVKNDAQIDEKVTATTNTGDNEAVGAETVTTGENEVQVQTADTTNTTITGSNWMLIQITNPDYWEGVLLGANYPMYRDGDKLYIWWQLQGEGETPILNRTTQVSVTNIADIVNQLELAANTGSNKLESIGGKITTGAARITANIANTVNTTIVGDNWYYLLLNLFDEFEGNLVIPRPDLSISVSPSSAELKPGESVTVQITVTNTGESDAQGITVSLGLPDFISSSNGTSWTIPYLQAGESTTITLVLNTDPSFKGSVTLPLSVITSMTELSKDNNKTTLSLAFIAQQTVVSSTRQTVRRVVVRPRQVVRRVVSRPRIVRSTTRRINTSQQDLLSLAPKVLAASTELPEDTAEVPTAAEVTKKPTSFCKRYKRLCTAGNTVSMILPIGGIWWLRRKMEGY